MIGKSLAHYEIASRLGKGGMGEVYQATDTKLGRDVAIKVLPQEFARDTERIARFQREAKLLASLNHPNIAAIYGLEESGGTNFLVMELVEGQTLDARVKAGRIPVEESLELALQIAEALEAAHEKGVIHRDLKPANIKVTPEVKVKVLDFGLAKAFAGEQSDSNLSYSPTLSDMATQQGVILGTAAYMSPEQARGKPVDKRTDVWAFGCVLYEMLTGQAAFQGEDVTEILASVVKTDVRMELLQADIHPKVPDVIDRCLQKDPKKRYRDIGDVKLELEKVLEDSNGLFQSPAVEPGTPSGLKPVILAAAITACLAVLCTAVVVWNLRAPGPGPVTRFHDKLPEGRKFFDLLYQKQIAVSPDGTCVAYCTNEGLFLRFMNEIDPRLILGKDEIPEAPFFSPDSKWIGYFSSAERGLKKISVGGGAPVLLCNIDTYFLGASWDEGDTIVYSDYRKGIMKVAAAGGDPEQLIKVEGTVLVSPQLLPDGKSLLFTLESEQRFAVQSLGSGERKVLNAGFGARYIATGHIVYGQANTLYCIPFDAGTLEAAGGPVPLIEGMLLLGNVPQYAVSRSGTLAYIPGSGSAQASLEWYDRGGNLLGSVGEPAPYMQISLSPNDKRAVAERSTSEGFDLWVIDLEREGVGKRFTTEAANERDPIWSPDGQFIAFNSDKNGPDDLYRKSLAGEQEAELLLHAEERLVAEDWSGDNSYIAYIYDVGFSEEGGINLLPLSGDNREPIKVVAGPFTYDEPKFSPDNNWIAYTSNETGTTEVYIKSLKGKGESQRISIQGGDQPRWNKSNGKEIFYIAPDGFIMAVELKGDPLAPGQPERLFQTNIFVQGGIDQYDVTHDGKRFLIVNQGLATETSDIAVVLNWFEELKQKMPD